MRIPGNISILPAFGDNYIYLVQYSPTQCFVVDPGNAHVVSDALAAKHLQLTHIFVTHHHADHIGGISTLKDTTGCLVIGPDEKRIGTVDKVMTDGDTLELATYTVHCIATPGHTKTSVCFWVDLPETPVLFSGDTLFVCGCGRMFECDGQTMFASLQKLTALPDHTLVYPGHDYTEENLKFALTIELNNEGLKRKLDKVKSFAANNTPTVPSLLAEEKQLNLFLKAPDWQTFSKLRKKKDVF